ncbi:hypothetical protein H0H87_008883 [Tephrocybe sp. NHM501043]|nr:hypothetical protein H0H87_008883 [Tephrocybe sp. NHM501043]
MGSGKKMTKPQLRARQTRSSKGRLLTSTSPEDSTAQLTSQLRSLGLYAASTVGDGNCLFRALSDQLYGSPSQHAALRGRICDFIEKHRERYEPFVEDERGVEVHLACMREMGTYGGHVELSACAHMERRDVKVVQPGLVYVIEWRAFAGSPKAKPNMHIQDKDPPESAIYVAYHDWEHFSSIRNLRGPHTGLPCVRETPPPPVSPPAPQASPAKHKKNKKVTLKLSAASPLSSLTPSPSPTPAPPALDTPCDPTTIPLPCSRSASPMPAPTPVHLPLQPHLLPTPPQPQALATHASSPKRALDDDESASQSSFSSGSAKRSRHSHSLSSSSHVADHALPTPTAMDVDADSETEPDLETPALSPPSSSSSQDSHSSSSSADADPLPTPPSSSPDPDSELSSPEPSPPPPDLTRRQIKERVRTRGAEKPLTRRERKRLGLPKLRNVPGGGVESAGRIVIPGGRFKRGVGVGVGAGEGEGEGEGEWERNGTGRVDVRGFRELKI